MFLPVLTDTTTLMIAALGAVLVIALVWIVRLEMKIRALTRGADGRSLEDSVISSRRRIEAIEHFRKELEAYLTSVEKRLKRSVQGVSTVRFNPWKGTGEGGNQSFATAFLDENGDGVIVSTLYARERMSIFAKPIVNGSSEIMLSDEEKETVEKAKRTLS